MIPRFLIGRDTNPHRNLAREEALLLACERGELDGAALYLWQNANTVVIGRAQNAWRECATEQMRLDGCTLARHGLSRSGQPQLQLHRPARAVRSGAAAVGHPEGCGNVRHCVRVLRPKRPAG